MKKIFFIFGLFCAVMFISSSAQASMTVSNTQNASNWGDYFIPDNATPYPGPYYGYNIPGARDYYLRNNEDWGWTHTVTFNVNPLSPIEILGARLIIEAWDVDDTSPLAVDEIDNIIVGTTNGAGGEIIGNLVGVDKEWSTTMLTFTPEALSKISVVGNTATVDVWMDISALQTDLSIGDSYSWYVTLKNATLQIDYVPAPGALLLGSLGVGVVGWFRRRRSF